MTKFILIRHGKPTYDDCLNLGFKGNGLALAKLTEEGIEEIKKTAQNKELENSDILVSSPYTRAMQSASIIARKLNLDITVETLLHEWIPDTSNSYDTEEEFLNLIRLAKQEWEIKKQNPSYICSDKTESIDHVQDRALNALSKYLDYNKVIIVAHGLLISTLFSKKIKLKTGSFITITDTEINENLKQMNMEKRLCKK